MEKQQQQQQQQQQQPEALILANDRPSAIGDDLYQWALDSEAMIRRLHARVEELEAMLSAVGASAATSEHPSLTLTNHPATNRG